MPCDAAHQHQGGMVECKLLPALSRQEKIECSNMRLGRQLHTCALGWRLIPELKLEFPAFPVKTSAQRTELLELAAVPLPGQLPAQHRARHILVETRAVLSSCA
ncbi:hypothetical protein ABBQ38_013907 [Trebouxia sp. C0009 RCD-2024]